MTTPSAQRRADIEHAASRSQNGLFPYARELELLAIALRDGENVELLTGSRDDVGTGLFALTSHRCLFLRRGRHLARTHEFPRHTIEDAEYRPAGADGQLTLRSANRTTVFHILDPGAGAAIATAIHARTVSETAVGVQTNSRVEP
jgi:hypothetical protein